MATIHIQSGKNNLDHSLRNCNIQSVPFKIHADCDAKVAKYFDNYVKTNEDKTLTGSFRGYPLRGKKVDVPEGYLGLVLHESIKPSRDKDERKFYVINNFTNLTFWNWDRVPSANDSITQALQWIDIADALREDMENYIYFKLMKNVPIKMKPGVVPHIFDCQKMRKPMHTVSPRNAFLKRQRQRDLSEPSTSTKRSRLSPDNDINIQELQATQEIFENTQESAAASIDINKSHKYVQVNIKAKMRSKSTECNILRPPKRGKQIKKPSKKTLKTYYPSDTSDTSNTSTFKPMFSEFSSTEELDQIWNLKKNIEMRTIYVIEKNPKLYIGVPSHSLFIVDLLSTRCQLKKIEIFITLKKIKLNLPYSILADDFGTSASTVCSIIKKSLPKLVAHLKSFIQWKSRSDSQKCLPIPFRKRFKNVQCIIDCFEISIQKSKNPILQSFSWSEYKKTNTIKYLVACTPDGLISYISSGFGGRTTDKMIVEESGFLNMLENGAHIMADRGFKHIDELLIARNNVLIRPPSVLATVKNSKEEMKQSKRIASLRIHVERVISRIREYSILEPHACVHTSLIKYLDHIVIIACALINVQDYLLK